MPLFRTPRFTRTLSQWPNLLIDLGFVLELVAEPGPSDHTVREHPVLRDAQLVAHSLHVRVRKM